MAATLPLKLVRGNETRLASMQIEPAPEWRALASLVQERFGLDAVPTGVTYVDVEGDVITVSSDEEVSEMFSSFEGQSSATIHVIAEHGPMHLPPPHKPPHNAPCDPKTKDLLDKIRQAIEADPSLGHEIHLILHEGSRDPRGPGGPRHHHHGMDHPHGPPPHHSGPAGRGRGAGPGHRRGGHRGREHSPGGRHHRRHSRGRSPSSDSDSNDSDSEGPRRHAPPPPPPPPMHGFPPAAPPPFGFPFNGPPGHVPPPHPPHFGHRHPRHPRHMQPCGFSPYAADGFHMAFSSLAPPPPPMPHAFCAHF